MTMTDSRYLTVAEVAERLHVGEEAVRAWLRAGRLGGFRPGARRTGWRISEADLQAFIERATSATREDRR